MTDDALQELLTHLQTDLLAARTAEGVWEGRLSSSALATAVAVFALHKAGGELHRTHIFNGLRWLAEYQHPDGGWGDAEALDPANLSSTLLCYAAIKAIAPEAFAGVLRKAEEWIVGRAGSMTPGDLSRAVYAAYGKDRTFAVPILTMCALAGLLGEDGWRFVVPLPFELAVLPRGLFRKLKLTVVSYALPALIAIGQVKHYFDPSPNAAARFVRRRTVAKTLCLLESIQPSNGGFLEAAPLTGFVTMSLAAMGLKGHAVVQKGVRFLIDTVRADGSWPIDTNLSTWCTSLAVNALLADDPEAMPLEERRTLVDWYLRQQFRTVHPYTGAAPGGWAWNNLPGAVPDADDTAGALIALHRLDIRDANVDEAVRLGLTWLVNLQNSDGGIPTFCRGWGKLEFDRSCPDITAHAILAWQLWQTRVDRRLANRIDSAIGKATRYLAASQQADGSWVPLWFGNPFSADHANPLYGTARVLPGIEDLEGPGTEEIRQKATRWIVKSQNADGGWGSACGQRSTCEETALAMAGLAAMDKIEQVGRNTQKAGLLWIAEHSGPGIILNASPVGLYFAKLWYAEKLYPLVFLLLALKKHFLAKLHT